jgi:hypothetical protein
MASAVAGYARDRFPLTRPFVLAVVILALAATVGLAGCSDSVGQQAMKSERQAMSSAEASSAGVILGWLRETECSETWESSVEGVTLRGARITVWVGVDGSMPKREIESGVFVASDSLLYIADPVPYGEPTSTATRFKGYPTAFTKIEFRDVDTGRSFGTHRVEDRSDWGGP